MGEGEGEGFISGGMLALAALGYLLAFVVVGGAFAHTDPCHTQHTCPSDHHTYVWTDPTTGRQWDCVEPGAREYNPLLDTTAIVWLGRTYYCRAAGGTTTTTTRQVCKGLMKLAAARAAIRSFKFTNG